MPALFEISLKALIVQIADREQRLEDKVLLLKRHSFSGDLFWDCPGGRIEDGETFETVLARELREEIGYDGTRFTIDAPIDAKTWNDASWQGAPKLLLYFPVFVPDLGEIRLSSEHAGYQWVGRSELAGLAEAAGCRLESDLVDTLGTLFDRV